jgi:hypothetical protein
MGRKRKKTVAKRQGKEEHEQRRKRDVHPGQEDVMSSRPRELDNLRQYLGSHDPAKGPDTAQLAAHLSPLCTKDGIAVLLDAADSKCIEDSVSARVALGLMFGQGPNDDYWVRLKRGVDWDRLSIETDRMMNRTNDIGGVWRSWLSVADSDLKSGLRSQTRPPDTVGRRNGSNK